MAQVILLGLIQVREYVRRAPMCEIIQLKQFIYLTHIQYRHQYTYGWKSCIELIFSTERDSSSTLRLIPRISSHVLANSSAAFSITVLLIYHMQRDNISDLIYHISSATNVFLEMEQDILECIFHTFKMNAEILYTTITCRTSYFEITSLQLWQLWCHTLGVSHVSGLYNSFSWRKSSLQRIFRTVKLQDFRSYVNFVTCR